METKLIIEHAHEHRNIERGNASDIFALKQFGWRDKTEVGQHTTSFDVVGYVEALEERNAKLTACSTARKHLSLMQAAAGSSRSNNP